MSKWAWRSKQEAHHVSLPCVLRDIGTGSNLLTGNQTICSLLLFLTSLSASLPAFPIMKNDWQTRWSARSFNMMVVVPSSKSQLTLIKLWCFNHNFKKVKLCLHFQNSLSLFCGCSVCSTQMHTVHPLVLTHLQHFVFLVALIIKEAGDYKHGHCQKKMRSVILVLYCLG